MPPETIVVDGVTYVRMDGAGLPHAIERTYNVAQLHELSGMSRSGIYRAMDEGRLAYVLPNGTRSGRRVRESEWLRFMAESTA